MDHLLRVCHLGLAPGVGFTFFRFGGRLILASSIQRTAKCENRKPDPGLQSDNSNLGSQIESFDVARLSRVATAFRAAKQRHEVWWRGGLESKQSSESCAVHIARCQRQSKLFGKASFESELRTCQLLLECLDKSSAAFPLVVPSRTKNSRRFTASRRRARLAD